ncbi:MAG: heterodisulfide reductase-related iron-sulfur binding cluster [Alphaproteobacteria bacterium]|jgi:heterodisulfide reductase subunit B|nr:heterodisulfide reductase-related iron-sulfur binding cluster [Alphaproteobacteria bacterium]MDP6589051.1 heterodisulfide reductase-related iron-sulfur binding cluster [Alphaproteobacteria bacterium]MDP6817059.1 heterodisulfide reductase-related iron-sulfur binding cluster [Alphaproteobacteria bacterium]|tara:strand:+ start:2700 stop:4040 length:1341 start_codon:yes stop_codon:yes gene_type:complete
MDDNSRDKDRFTGHGAEWRDSGLSEDQARAATSWVEARIDRRAMMVGKSRVEDVRDIMWQLEKDGEIIVHRIADEHEPETVKTLYGWDKKIPTNQLWHHKSCGQCGNIPGYPTSILWLQNMLGTRYLDETDQTSCTAWNYHGSGIGNVVSLAAVFLRNFHQAYVSAKAQGLAEGYYYPLIHCGTSFGNYKEMRGFLLHSAELRGQVKKILAKLGRLVDGKLLIPEEIVHYSEWLHVSRQRIKEHQRIDCGNIRATVHPACHVYKMVPEDAIYDDAVLDGNRLAVTTALMQELGTEVIDYSTWYDCCGFGFRHIISEREFTRSFAIDRKIRVAVEEASADVMIGHDTGCITTLDKNQWIGKAVDKHYELPIMADCQFAALMCGAHPYKIVQLHWHASPFENLMEKLGMDWRSAKAEFESYLGDVEAGRVETLYDPKNAITSGPGFSA